MGVCHLFDPLFPQHSLLKCLQAASRSHPLDLVWVEEGLTHYLSVDVRGFVDLANLKLTPLKVSYDLIETDYEDNSITQNHVG